VQAKQRPLQGTKGAAAVLWQQQAQRAVELAIDGESFERFEQSRNARSSSGAAFGAARAQRTRWQRGFRVEREQRRKAS
jgi:hypothetical protein